MGAGHAAPNFAAALREVGGTRIANEEELGQGYHKGTMASIQMVF